MLVFRSENSTAVMARWTPKKQTLASQMPEGSEDVVFRKSQHGPNIVKAHAAVLAHESEVFRKQFYPIPAGQTLPRVLCDWTQGTESEVALKV